MPGNVDSEVNLSEVLLLVSDGTVQIGTPFLSKVSVKGKVLEQKKGEKIHVHKFKAKARYRRSMGFRPQLTKIEILSEAPFSKKVVEKKVEEKETKSVKSAPKQVAKPKTA